MLLRTLAQTQGGVMQATAPPPHATAAGWWDALIASLTVTVGMIVRGLLKFIGFLLIILVGWIISAWIGRAVAAVLRKVRFNDLAERTGFGKVITRMGARSDASGLLAEVIKW